MFKLYAFSLRAKKVSSYMQEKIIILDFGSQYTQLIARRVRELNVYCEIHPLNHLPVLQNSFGEFDRTVKGVILSGSPYSVRQPDAPQIDFTSLQQNYPILGICYGAQYIAQKSEGEVKPASTREYGRAKLEYIDNKDPLFKNIAPGTQTWMSHADTIASIPDNFEIIASTDSVKVAAFHIKNTKVYGIQFHPEVTHSTDGKQLLENFLVDICGCRQDWTPDAFIETTVSSLRKQLGDDKVILGLSGGVDSSVAAVLLHQAIGKNLHCIFVDNGLLRKGEFEQVLDSYQHMGLNVRGVRAGDRFLSQLSGLKDPEEKRKAIGRVFIEVFDDAAHEVQNVKWLGQGTIYPDVIESVSVKGPSATIKSHHNVGGLPDFMKLRVVEPLNTLFKDEVRRVGKTLGMDSSLLGRHPFPGPGLAIRILDDITPEKVAILQEADFIYINNLKS